MTESRLDPPLLVVTRWTRYGKDRAYVSDGDRQLGYRDLNTGDVHGENAGDDTFVRRVTEELWQKACARRYVPRHAHVADGNPEELPPRPVPPQSPDAPRRAPSAAPLLADRDLTANRPGELVRAQAVALRDAAPVSSRLARVLGVKTEERGWRIGADAEEAVAKQLERLGREWRVLHAIPVGERGSDIDHLVVGPAGVFVVNTKHHPDASVWVRGDTVKVNGAHHPYVRNSRFEASRAARLLTARARFDVEVRGVIAVKGAPKGFTVVAQPRDVVVVTHRSLAAHLAALPAVLGTPSIARVHEVARHLATWQPKTVAWRDGL